MNGVYEAIYLFDVFAIRSNFILYDNCSARSGCGSYFSLTEFPCIIHPCAPDILPLNALMRPKSTKGSKRLWCLTKITPRE